MLSDPAADERRNWTVELVDLGECFRHLRATCENNRLRCAATRLSAQISRESAKRTRSEIADARLRRVLRVARLDVQGVGEPYVEEWGHEHRRPASFAVTVAAAAPPPQRPTTSETFV